MNVRNFEIHDVAVVTKKIEVTTARNFEVRSFEHS